MKKIFTLFVAMILSVGIMYAQTLLPSGGSIQDALDAAASGDVIELESGGIYETHDLKFLKSITLKAVDGASVRPVIYQKGSVATTFGEEPIGADILIEGVEFTTHISKYFLRMEGGDSIASLKLSDVVAHGYAITAIRASNGLIYIDSLSIDNCHFYDFGGNKERLFYLRNAGKGNTVMKQFKMTNSTFSGFDRCFLKYESDDVDCEIIIDQCNIHGRSADKDDDFFDIRGTDGSSFELTNSIISGDKNNGKFWDIRIDASISNVYFHDNAIGEAILTGQTWVTDVATSVTDPLFSNPAEGGLFLDAASPALTASTTAGPIGDPRWVTAPAKSTLLGINIDQGLMQSFAGDVLSYDISLPYLTSEIAVEAIAAFADATITGDGTIDMSSGNATVEILVVGSNRTSTTYTLNIANDGPDATLTALVPDVGSLDPAFDPDIFSYRLMVPTGTDSVFFDFTPFDVNAIVTDLDTVDVIALFADEKDAVNFNVSSENAAFDLRYTVNITYPSEDSTLSNLATTDGILTPAFASNVYEYTLAVKNVDSVFFDFAASSSYATVVDTDTVDVRSGSGVATFTVTAEDGVAEQTYTVTIAAEFASSDATLAGIIVSPGTLTPAFDAAVMDYTVLVPYGTTSVAVGATATDEENADVTGTGNIDVSSGAGTATIVVTAEDGETKKTYTVVITVEAPSTDATLSALALDPLGTLSPVFDPAVETYTADVPIGTTSVTVTATAADANATVSGDDPVDVSSGSGTATVVVTAQDNSTKTYTVNISVLVSVDLSEAVKAHMYYNGMSDMLVFENASKIESVEIFNITGKKISSMNTYMQETLEMNTSDLSTGVYIVRMKLSGTNMQTAKFIK